MPPFCKKDEVKRLKILLLFGLLLTVPVLKSTAQKDITTQHLFWARYFLKLNVSSAYQARQELEERVYWFPWRQHQFMSRTHLIRKIGKGWKGGIGFTYFLQSLPHDPEVADFYTNTELRPQLELSYKQDISDKIAIEHRYWSEFRFFEEDNGAFDYGNTRIRYRLQLKYSPLSKVTLRAFDEIFLNFGKKIVQNVFDQNRYGVSVQYMIVERFGFELGYFNWFQQRPSGVDFFKRHIVRLTIHQIIK